MIAGSLEVQMFASMARLVSDMDAAKRTVGNAVATIEKALGAIGVGFGAHELLAKIDSVTEGMAKLKDASEKTGASVEDLSKLQFFAGTAGKDIGSVEQALGQLAKAMSAAGNATSAQALAFAKLQISARDSLGNEKDLNAIYREIATALDKYSDGAGKNAIARALMGKAGADQIPIMKKIGELGDIEASVTTAQAAAAEKYQIEVARLNQQKEILWNTVASALLPTMQTFVDVLLAASKETDSLGASTKRLADDGKITGWADDTAMGIARVADVAKTLIGIMSEIEAPFERYFKASQSGFAALSIKMGPGTDQEKDLALTMLREQAAKENAALRARMAGGSFWTTPVNTSTSDAVAAAIRARNAANPPGTGPWSGPVDQYGQPITKPSLNVSVPDKAAITAAAAELKLYEHAMQSLEQEMGKLDNQTMEERTMYQVLCGSLQHLSFEIDKNGESHAGNVLALARHVDALKQVILFTKTLDELQIKSGAALEKTEAEKVEMELYGRDVMQADGSVTHLAGSLQHLTEVQGKQVLAEAAAADARKASLAMRAMVDPTLEKDAAYLEDLKFQIDLLGKTATEQALLNEAHKIDVELRTKLLALAAQARASNDDRGQYAAAAALLVKQAADQKAQVLDVTAFKIAKERDWVTGAEQAYNDYIDNATNAALQTKNAFASGFKAMEDAVFNFFRHGKLGMSDFISAIKDALARLAAQKFVVSIVGSVGMGGVAGAASAAAGAAATPGGAAASSLSSLSSMSSIGSMFSKGATGVTGMANGVFQDMGVSMGSQWIADIGNYGFGLPFISGLVMAATGNVAGGIGSTLGGIAGSYFGPIGTIVGSTLGGMIGSMFGGGGSDRQAQDVGNYLTGSVSRGGLSGGGVTTMIGTPPNDYWGGSRVDPIPADSLTAFNKSVAEVFASMEAQAKALNMDTSGLAAITVQAANSGKGAQQDMIDVLAKTSDTIATTLMPSIAALQQSGESLTQTFVRVTNAAIQAKAALDAQKRSMEIQLMEAQGNAIGALAAKREDELKALDPSLVALQLQIYAAQDLASASTNAANSVQTLAQQITAAQQATIAAVDAEISASTSAANNAHRLADTYRSISASLLAEITKLMGGSKANTADIFNKTFTAAMGGDVASLQALPKAADDYLAASLATATSANAYARDQSRVVVMLQQANAAAVASTNWQEYSATLLETQVAVLEQMKEELSKTDPNTEILKGQLALLDAIHGAMQTQTVQVINGNLFVQDQTGQIIAGNALTAAQVDALTSGNAITASQLIEIIAGNALTADQIAQLNAGNALTVDQIAAIGSSNALLASQIVQIMSGNTLTAEQVAQVAAGNALTSQQVSAIMTGNSLTDAQSKLVLAGNAIQDAVKSISMLNTTYSSEMLKSLVSGATIQGDSLQGIFLASTTTASLLQRLVDLTAQAVAQNATQAAQAKADADAAAAKAAEAAAAQKRLADAQAALSAATGQQASLIASVNAGIAGINALVAQYGVNQQTASGAPAQQLYVDSSGTLQNMSQYQVLGGYTNSDFAGFKNEFWKSGGVYDQTYGQAAQLQAIADNIAAQKAIIAAIPGHALGLSYVPNDDYLMRAHKGEAVLTAPQAAYWRGGGSAANDDMLTEIKALRAEVSSLRRSSEATASNTGRQESFMRRISPDGNSITVTVAA